MSSEFTPTQQAILDLLSDGMSHHRDQLMKVLPDELAGRSALAFHLSTMRKTLRPRGQDIICEYVRQQIHYRHVQLLRHPAG